jgi:hypothetical protein
MAVAVPAPIAKAPFHNKTPHRTFSFLIFLFHTPVPPPPPIHGGEIHCQFRPLVALPFISPPTWLKIKNLKRVPWVLWKGALAIEGGTAAAMAIVLSQFARGVNLAISESLKESMTIHSVKRSSQNGQFYPAPEDMIGRILFLSMVFRN